MATTAHQTLTPVRNLPRGDQPAPTVVDSRSQRMLAVRGEVVGLVALLVAVALAYSVRLGSVILSDMDEGTYLYAGKLLAAGLIPYRDFLLAHPPLVVTLAAGWQLIAGPDIMGARFAYMVVVLASTVPLYLLARDIARSALAGLLAVAAYTTGMLLLANMGRTVRLEPIMDAFLIGGSALYLLRRNSKGLLMLVGALLAGALLVKLVAAVPIGVLFAAELIFVRRDRGLLLRWLFVAIGAAVVLVPTGLWLLAQPNFVDDVVRSQLDRPGLPIATRAYYLWQDFERYPVIPIALAASLVLVVRSRDARIRIISVVGLGSTVALVALFKTFFGYYLVQVLPWLAIVASVAGVMLLRKVMRRWRPVVIGAIALLGVAVPAAYGEYYYRTAHDHVSSPAQIVSLLRQDDGYIYSMYPSFSLWSGRPIYPWYFQADALVPRLNGRLTDDGFIEAFAGSKALVLYAYELADYPNARAYVEANFHQTYADNFFALWVR